MKSYDDFKHPVKVLFCDIDDTLTSHGHLRAPAYSMLWKLADKGVEIVPITGRPAGWCEMIARLWPVAGIIGENGAFYFRYHNKQMKRVFVRDEGTRKQDQLRLDEIRDEILSAVPGAALASDQFCRLFDLAIDFCEDVPRLDSKSIEKIVSIFEKHGAVAKVSSIHVNGWFGTHDKKTMCETFYKNECGRPITQDMKHCAFVGDSPNDEPMFGFFDNSFAVANIQSFLETLDHKPKFVMSKEGGDGFCQLGEQILKNLEAFTTTA